MTKLEGLNCIESSSRIACTLAEVVFLQSHDRAVVSRGLLPVYISQLGRYLNQGRAEEARERHITKNEQDSL